MIPLWNYARFTKISSSHHQAFWNQFDQALPDELRKRIQPGGDLRAIWEAAATEAAPKPPQSGSWLAICAPLVQQFEGCVLHAYPDPGTGGDPWTIGWGSTTYGDGSPVRPGDRIDQAQADQLLNARLQRDWQTLAGRIPGWGRMRPGQQACLVSFAYNVGVGFYQTSGFGTISRALSSQDWASVPNALMRYVNPGSSVEAGLRRRRTSEGAVWSRA